MAVPSIEKKAGGKNGTRMEVSQLLKLQRGMVKKELPKKYSVLSLPEALETAKLKLTGLGAHLIEME